jgi:hypothetical protein
MEFLEIPLIDDDFYKMMMRFVINTFFLTIVIRFLYFEKSRRKDYLLTYYMISTIVFFLCFTLKKFELDVGMALGLFAIFGILRYRTNPVDIREMTYLFIVIGVSVINALANKKMSYAEIMTANIIVVVLLAGIENYWILRQEVTKEVVYEKIENIKPENYNSLKSDLENRTGLTINRVEVGAIDFMKDTALVTIYYYNDAKKV